MPLSALTLLLACGQPASVERTPDVRAAAAPADGLAVVNGVPITDEDVALVVEKGGRDVETLTDRQRQNIVDVLVTKELRAQAAEQIGLDQNRDYQDRLATLRAKVNEHRREHLSDLFYKKQIEARATVSESELRAYFDAHQAEIRTEVHVLQILRRDRADAERVRSLLDKGMPFEEVAAAQYPKLPRAAPRPWDLGWLKWSQVPEPWVPVLPTLEPGQVSALIPGPRGRYWVLKLVARRQGDASYDAMKPIIETKLKKSKIEALRAETDAALRKKAGL